MQKKWKEKGVTLIALVITIIVLIILAGVAINALVGENGIITQAQKAKDDTEQGKRDEESGLLSLEEQINQALGESFNIQEGVNRPKLASGMTPIKFKDPTTSEKGKVDKTNSGDTSWYDYNAKKWANSQTEDGSMWVWIPRYAYKVNDNQTFDIKFLIGITDNYYDENGQIQTAKRCTNVNEEIDTKTGYTVHPAFTDETKINYRNGGWDKELTGIWVAKFEAGYASGNNSAPVKASSVSYSQSSVWVRAVEAGTDNGDSSQTARNWLDGIYGSTKTAIKYPTFQPVTYSMNYINHNDAFNIAKAMTENGNIYGLTGSADSHLMKNSEWGAVAYLSQSKYGLDGIDIAINNVNLNSGGAKRTNTAGKSGVDSVYAVTGCTTGSTTAGETVKTMANINETTGNTANNGVYTWDQLNGCKASSTGTIYGIYDLSGGTWERTAAYVANSHGELKTYGASIAYDGNILKTASTKYTTVYPFDSSTDNTGITNNETNLNTASSNNYKKNTLIYGDGIRETSTAGIGNTSWYSDSSLSPGLYGPFSIRGGTFWGNSGTGLFSFTRRDGNSYFYDGFRAVLTVS